MITSSLAEQLRNAQHVVAFTGAGASAESGIPTFRDELTGLWERFDPAQLATSEAFRADPSLCWGWYEWRRHKVLQAQPSGAHLAIAQLARHVHKLTVVTQNVDDLNERAGSSEVIHLQVLNYWLCWRNGAAPHFYDYQEQPFWAKVLKSHIPQPTFLRYIQETSSHYRILNA